MKRIKFYIIFGILYSSQWVYSQEESIEKNGIIEQRIEYIGGENEDVDYSTLFDNLYCFYDHPINLNNTKEVESLLELGLISEFQLLSLKRHIVANNKLMTIYELQAVQGFNMESIRNILPFVKVSQELFTPNVSIKEIIKNSSNEIYLRNIRDIEQKKGYSPKEEEGDTRYLGSPDKLYLRYRFRYLNKISVGFTAEKDQGEEFFRGSQKNGFDYYSAHFFMKDFGRLKALTVGDYHFQVGQGLTLWSGLAFGKSIDISSVKRNAVGIRHYTSADENNFLRGGAATFGITKRISLSAFYSRKKIDANITDTLDFKNNDVAFLSFQNSGFHRTNAELNDKDAIQETHFGGRVEFQNQALKIGVTGFVSRYGGVFDRNLSFYNQFEFANNKNSVFGMDYNYVHRNFNFFGEISRSENGGIAYVNGLLMSLDPRFSFTILHRNYGRDYQNLLSNGFSESNTRNEKGIYTGFDANLTKQFTLTGYMDFFTFPWLKFQAYSPNTDGYDYNVQLTYKKSRNFSTYVRLKHQSKELNSSVIESSTYQLVNEKRTNYKLHLSYKITDYLTFKNRVEIVNYQKGDRDKETGFLVYQDVVFKPKSKPYSFTARYALFDVESYNARVYAYENDVLYYFYIPAYYKVGSRFYLTARYKYRKKFDFWIRYGMWNYRNEEAILSGLEEIQGNIRSDVKVVVRYLF
jgi:hypothetical protein